MKLGSVTKIVDLKVFGEEPTIPIVNVLGMNSLRDGQAITYMLNLQYNVIELADSILGGSGEIMHTFFDIKDFIVYTANAKDLEGSEYH